MLAVMRLSRWFLMVKLITDPMPFFFFSFLKFISLFSWIAGSTSYHFWITALTQEGWWEPVPQDTGIREPQETTAQTPTDLNQTWNCTLGLYFQCQEEVDSLKFLSMAFSFKSAPFYRPIIFKVHWPLADLPISGTFERKNNMRFFAFN